MRRREQSRRELVNRNRYEADNSNSRSRHDDERSLGAESERAEPERDQQRAEHHDSGAAAEDQRFECRFGDQGRTGETGPETGGRCSRESDEYADAGCGEECGSRGLCETANGATGESSEHASASSCCW